MKEIDFCWKGVSLDMKGFFLLDFSALMKLKYKKDSNFEGLIPPALPGKIAARETVGSSESVRQV